MRFSKLLLGPLAVFALAVALLTGLNRRSDPAPASARARPAVVGAGASTAERIAALETNLRAGAKGASYVALGDAHLQAARETGDASSYARAEQAYAQALRRDRDDVAATIGTATLALARHDFRAGLSAGRRAARLAPEAAGPLPVLVDALVELGRYEEAASTLQELLDRRPGLAAYARASYLRELRGDIPGAVSAMRLAVDAGSASPEGTAYVQTLLGTLERGRGRLGPARAAYRAALVAQPGFPAADAGLARVEAAQGKLAPAIRRIRGVVERLPLPEHILTLGELELAAGRRQAAREDLDLVPLQRKLLGARGVNTDAELALYEADFGDTAAAVVLGRKAWNAAPSVRSADALGWALTRDGRAREGAAWGRKALRFGWEDPLARYHAAMSAKAAGQPGRARPLLRGLLERSPAFSPLYAPRARRALAELG